MPRIFTRLEHADEVKQRLPGELPLWFLLSGVLSGSAPWLYRSYQAKDFGTVELTDVVIGASVGAVLEAVRRLASYKTAAYEVYKEHANEAERVERELRDENASLLATLAAEQGKQPRRPKNQAISDALRRFHEKGNRLLYTSIMNSEERQAWKEQWHQFRSELFATMKEVGCSGSEIHKVKNLGAIRQLTEFRKTTPGALNLKSELICLMDRIGEIATSHDTTTPG